jgi:adenosylhomocysteine nucleosidase
MSTLICFALKEEAAPFHKIAAGRLGIFTLIVGIGRQNAEKSVSGFLNSCRSRGDETQIKNQSETPHVVAYTPDLVLTCGFAGGLNPGLKLGEVVFELSTANPQLSTRLLAAGAKPAKFFCAERIATTVTEKKKLRDETGADAVEMESAAIHAVCHERNIPCATVRVILDTANEDLPLDFNALAKPDKSLDFGKLFLTIAKSPGKIGELMELHKKTSFASQQLADMLEKVVVQP